ncbi:MAG: TRIC cation channel family protein [Dermatophilaceae bacterium]
MLIPYHSAQLALDLVGVFVFALSGGLVAVLGISDWRLLTAAGLGGLVTFLYQPGVERISRLVRVLDAVGLSAFAVSGSLKAVSFPDVPPTAAVLVGLITAVGGGVIRDVLAGQVPEVWRRELYALPALVGSTIVVIAAELGGLTDVVLWSAVALIFSVRVLAVRLDLNAPQPLQPGLLRRNKDVSPR